MPARITSYNVCYTKLLRYGIEVLALHVLDEGYLEPLLEAVLLDDRRHLGETRDRRGPPAALPGDDAVAAGAVGFQYQRLDDAVAPDRLGQLSYNFV